MVLGIWDVKPGRLDGKNTPPELGIDDSLQCLPFTANIQSVSLRDVTCAPGQRQLDLPLLRVLKRPRVLDEAVPRNVGNGESELAQQRVLSLMVFKQS